MTEPRLLLVDIFQRYHDMLSIRSGLTGAATNHALSKGERREDLVKTILRDNLAEHVGVSTGQIFDRSLNLSRQCDIVLYNKLCLCFRDDMIKQFPIDSILGLIEVKTKLNKHELSLALGNILSVKKMSITEPETTVGRFNNKALCCVVAFESIGIEKMSGYISDFYREEHVPPDQRADIIYVNNRGIIGIRKPSRFGIRFNSTDQEKFTTEQLSNSDLLWVRFDKDALLILISLLSHCLNNPRNYDSNFFKYIEPLGLTHSLEGLEIETDDH